MQEKPDFWGFQDSGVRPDPGVPRNPGAPGLATLASCEIFLQYLGLRPITFQTPATRFSEVLKVLYFSSYFIIFFYCHVCFIAFATRMSSTDERYELLKNA